MDDLVIQDVETFVTAPAGINLVVVKVQTSEPGLYGYGCATFTWRFGAVVRAIEDYLKPMVIGRSALNSEDLWQTMMGSSYWRNGPILNNAISGIDEALWDIKGKLANLPVYQLLGGKAREGLAVYRHADGSCYEEVKENIAKFQAEGYRYIRCQMGTYGGNTGGGIQSIRKPSNAPEGAYYDPKAYIRNVVTLMEKIRSDFGWSLEILHDVHERLPLADTLTLTKEMEPFKLFFLEDSLPPDQTDYYKILRFQTSVPLAMGELFTNPVEWKRLIQNQWIDFIRTHLSDIGGLTPAIKLAHYCDSYGVRSAWHGPGDLSPIGAAAQMHLDLNIPNFGIQECAGFTTEEQEVFPGCPTLADGYAYIHEAPGFGVEFDEGAAKRYPPVSNNDSWVYTRLPDGTAVRP